MSNVIFLEKVNCNFESALCWGNCLAHWKAFTKEQGWTVRAVIQLGLTGFGCLPIIGQIFSLLELGLAWIYYSFFESPEEAPLTGVTLDSSAAPVLFKPTAVSIHPTIPQSSLTSNSNPVQQQLLGPSLSPIPPPSVLSLKPTAVSTPVIASSSKLYQDLNSIAVKPGKKLADVSQQNFYIITNESNHEEIWKRLDTIPQQGNVVVGVAGLQNLHFFAHRPDTVDHLVLIDPDPAQAVLWDIVIQSIKENDDLKKATDAIIMKIAANFTDWDMMQEKYNKVSTIAGIVKRSRGIIRETLINIGSGWQKIKKAVDQNKIIYFPMNLGDTARREAFTKVLDNCNYTIDTLYVSNVHFKRWLGETETLNSIHSLLGNKNAIVLITADDQETAKIESQEEREESRDKSIVGHIVACEITNRLSRIPMVSEQAQIK